MEQCIDVLLVYRYSILRHWSFMSLIAICIAAVSAADLTFAKMGLGVWVGSSPLCQNGQEVPDEETLRHTILSIR